MAVQHRGSNWTPDEDRRLLDLIEERKSWVFISANLKRPAKTVRDRFAYLRRQAKKTDSDGKLVELEEMGTKLQATARALPSGPDRHNILQEIGRFCARIVALQGADLRPAQGLREKGK
jgi:hypothetical protein